VTSAVGWELSLTVEVLVAPAFGDRETCTCLGDDHSCGFIVGDSDVLLDGAAQSQPSRGVSQRNCGSFISFRDGIILNGEGDGACSFAIQC